MSIEAVYNNTTINTLLQKYVNELKQELGVVYVADFVAGAQYQVNDKVIFKTTSISPNICYKCIVATSTSLPTDITAWEVYTEDLSGIITEAFFNIQKSLINWKTYPVNIDDATAQIIILLNLMHLISLDRGHFTNANPSRQIASQSAHGLSISYGDQSGIGLFAQTKYGQQLSQGLSKIYGGINMMV